MKIKQIIFPAILIILIGLSVFYFTVLNKKTKLILTVPFKNTTVYLDDKKKTVTKEDNQTLEFDLSQKVHTIATEKSGYFPWQKEVLIKENVTKINPIFVTSNTTGVLITKNDNEYYTLRAKVTSQILPNEFNTKKLSNGDELWVEDNSILVRKNENGGKNVYFVIKPVDKIRSVDFYKESSDNILFASDVGVYLIDTKAEGFQNFFPIYKGTNPIFINNATTSIYVLDGENLMLVAI